MSRQISVLNKELGTTNNVLIRFLAEEYPTWGISDYNARHSKTIADLYKEEIVEKFERHSEAHPGLKGMRKPKNEADAPAPESELKSETPAAPVQENMQDAGFSAEEAKFIVMTVAASR